MNLLIAILVAALVKVSLTVSSTAFQNNGMIPSKFTCDGANINPPLKIAGLPADAKSMAIILDDPDAPNGTFVHWVIWNIKPMDMIAENSAPGVQGKNGTGKMGYFGPCPPTGTHHYHFKVYALDATLDLQEGADKKALETAMSTHIVGYGELIGTYAKATKIENK
ncbi:MAG TPA: YbhB/YbcL family Raf kinase inhibitor-like protein [Chitinophagales bacterium]|nr:YbhB/YbcL family Raf kinase inhibitor-like protein [Chitinophagales bacterium]